MKKLLLLLLFSSCAFSQLPVVENISSSLPTSTTIRIDYTVNANGSNTSVVIKFGLTPSNLNQTFNCPNVTGNTPVAQFRIVSGSILSGTTYYYSVEATNDSGTTTINTYDSGGGIQAPFQFTTTSPPNLPEISNVHVVSLFDGGAIIGYTINANGFNTNTFVQAGLSSNNYNAGNGTGATITSSTPVNTTTSTGFGTIFFDNPGATVYFRVYASSSIGFVASAESQSILVYRPNFGSYTYSNGGLTNVDINYTLNPNGASTTSVFRYGLSLGNYTNSVTGITASGFTPNTGSVTISSLTPGTTYYGILEATNEYGVTQSNPSVFRTPQIPLITNVSASNITTTGATVNFSINPYSESAPIIPIIRYGIDPNNLNLIQNCAPVTSYIIVNQSQNLTGLTSGVTYYYRVEATNPTGTGGNLATPSQFTTIATVTTVPSPIYNFEFNNSLVSQDGLVTMGTPFPNTLTYVSNGSNPLSAIQFNLDRNITQLTSLPVGTSSRTVHFRIKYATNALSSENHIFNYGTYNTAGLGFSFSQTATSAKFVGYGAAADYIVPVTTNTNVWYEYMLVYNGTSISIYRDGVSLGSQNVTINTTGDILRLGQSITGITNLKADIDYFRVFNTALTPLEVAFINSNPAVLSSLDFNQNNLEVALYPNPVNEVLNIETALEIQSVEIYNIQGQKVMSSNQKQINVSDLATGIYMIRIQDTDNAIATKKFVKE